MPAKFVIVSYAAQAQGNIRIAFREHPARDVIGITMSGLFAAGDVTDSELKQVITAASKGASAAFEALRYLDENTECSL